MAKWRIKRYVVEEYHEEAATREEALENPTDPSSIVILRETAVREHRYEADEAAGGE